MAMTGHCLLLKVESMLELLAHSRPSLLHVKTIQSSNLIKQHKRLFSLIMILLEVNMKFGLKMLDQFKLNFMRSEEHTSELQSRGHLVCRLLLEKKKYKRSTVQTHT